MHLSVAKEVVAMTMRGLVLITVCLANVLAAQADCCKCDCQQSGALHSPLYYLPVVASHQPASSHGIYQSLGQVPVSDVSRYAQGLYSSGYQTTGNAAQYTIAEGHGIENSLDAGNKVAEGTFAFGIQKEQQQLQQPSFDYKGQGPLASTSTSLASGSLGHQQVSKVSTHQGNHYINIEQQVTPHESSSVEEVNSLEHGKDHHHHGKDDHYKFEYGVNDQHTHDIKSHKEEKNGDVVRGEYSLVEDDGNVRTVKYYADWKTGFHAQVHNSKSTSLG